MAPTQAYVPVQPDIRKKQPEADISQALGNATIVRNNPPGVVYRAEFPKDSFFKDAYPDGGNIEGSVIAVANPNGVGVIFSIDWQNLPKAGGPFSAYRHYLAPTPRATM